MMPIPATAAEAIATLRPLLEGPDLAAAALVGAAAVVLNARVALLGPALVAGLALAEANGWAPPDWASALLPAAVALAIALGVLQAAITALAGREAAATAMGIVVIGGLLAVAWYGPRRLLRRARGGGR